MLNIAAKVNLQIPKISECLPENGLFACSDGVTCIPLTQLCNNQTECLHGDDEGPLCCELPQIVFVQVVSPF